jgi:DNA-binding MarR family transcriptional regulator
MPKDAKDIKQMFLQKKPCQILLAAYRLKKPHVSALMKEADTTFAHTANILSDMESYGLVEFYMEGRARYVRLTASGRELARSLSTVDGLLDGKRVLRKISTLEKSIDRLEENLKSTIHDGRSEKARRKRMEAILERAGMLEAEARRYNNDALGAAMARIMERLDYLKTKIQRYETTPQDT